MSTDDITVYDSKELENAPPDAWLWCLHCNRFFQQKHLRGDRLGKREQCAFCSAAGLGVDVWPWAAFRRKHWPRSEAHLRYGQIAS